MLYIRLDKEDANSLEYYCRNCGNVDNLITKDNLCISTTNLTSQDSTPTHNINLYTKYDPTLPRTTTIKCPNAECISNQEDGETNREVIYIRYDDKNMKYLYLCKYCNKSWKTNEN
jgi:DNA-directed RNA polymerase subunit M/transcription elongation factor TFIIS